MEKLSDWTDEELIQTYDLQEKYVEKVVDFVRHGEENEVLKFLKMIPELHSYDECKFEDNSILRRSEFAAVKSREEALKGRYFYKDVFGNGKSTDTLREIFEEKYQWEFVESRPEVLAMFAGNKDIALEFYSVERYEKLREEIPQRLMSNIKNLIMKYPKEIEEKAMRTAIYGHTSEISRGALLRYRNENMPEFERLQFVVQQESVDTIVAAYDLQVGLKIYNSDLSEGYLTGAIRNFVSDEKIFEIVYGEKAAEILRKANEKVIKLASRYDFVNTEEKLSVLENHKICLFGTTEQKIRLSYKRDPFCVSEKDFQIILDELANKYEREGFSKKYYPNNSGNKNYAKQSYKVVGRVKTKTELQPQWNIIFADGKIVTAEADEIISSAINERLYGEQFEKFGKRPLSEVLISGNNEKLTLSEGKEKISAIIHQLQVNGESISKLKDFLEDERRNLSNTNVR